MGEPSHQGKKRASHEIGEGHSVRDECSESSPQKKKTRGKTTLQVMATGEKNRKNVEWNEFGQPVGVDSIRFSSTLGCIARELVPINVCSWDKVETKIKSDAWKLLMQKYTVDASHKKLIFMMMGKLWRSWKSALSISIREVLQSGQDHKRHIALIKPADVKQKEWDAFVTERMSDGWKAKSEKMRKIRAQQTLQHTLSRRGYARLEHAERTKNPDKPLSRPELWIKGHIPKKAKMSEAVAITIEKIKEKMSSTPASENPIDISEDALTEVLGKERPGRVRALGFGVTPTKVNAQIESNSWRQSLVNDMSQLLIRQKQLEDSIAQFASYMQGKTGEEVAKCPDPTPKSPECSTQVPPNVNLSSGNLVKAKCTLLNWDGTGQEVARAEIESTDPTTLIHHVVLGPDCYKVWVQDIVVHQVPLFRSSREFFLLDDALGSTVAWPHKYIRID